MCVVSMVMDHYYDRWAPYRPTVPPPPYTPLPNQTIPQQLPLNPILPTKEEVDEFHKLLERARQYDIDHNEPECELEEKKEKLRKLAEELGVEINFGEPKESQ